MTHRLTVFVAVLAALLRATAAHAGEPNTITNGDFTGAATDTGAPEGWQHRTAGKGFVRVESAGGETFVAIGVNEAGEDSFIQQVMPLSNDVISVTFTGKARHENIEPGEKGYQKGVIQGRFTQAGKEMGSWINIGSFTGTQAEWREFEGRGRRPADADGVMIRMGMYGVKSGRLDVAGVQLDVRTQADVAVDRAKYRPAEEYGPAVTDARYAKLARGVNINNWFCQPWNISVNGQKGGFNAETFRGYITEHDLKLIKAAGFTHVRLPTDPLFLMDRKTGDLVTDLLPEYDRALKMIVDHGLAVIVDAHPKSPPFKKMSRSATADNFVIWWGNLAKHLAATTDPEWVFLEPLNEPGGQGYWAGDSYEAYSDRLVTVIRANAPDHTLIVGGGGYMLVTELDRLRPHPDRNIVYTMHYYEPSPFTHQGAVWMKDWYRPLRNVPWPLTQENLNEAQAAVVASDKSAEHARKALASLVSGNYGTEAQYVREQLQKVADWGKANNRRMHVGEWGVYTKYAPRDSRLRYLDAITRAMHDLDLAWSKWDYVGGGFEIVANPAAPSAKRELDAEVIAALNLSGQ